MKSKIIKGFALAIALIGAAVKAVDVVDAAYKKGYDDGLRDGEDNVYAELNEIAEKIHKRFNNESPEPV